MRFSHIEHERLFRAIAGAVRNAGDAHPSWNLNRTIAASIAKRAAGTLMAQKVMELAAMPSESCQSPRAMADSGVSSAGGQSGAGTDGEEAPTVNRRFLRSLACDVGHMAKRERDAGNDHTADALVEVLRKIAKME
jgi:hypothetical protein